MKRFVKAYDWLFEEHDFYNRVKELILNGDEKVFVSFNPDVVEEAFEHYLDNNYTPMDIFGLTLEDRVDAVDDFCDEFFSWVDEDDFAELVLQDAYKKGE